MTEIQPNPQGLQTSLQASTIIVFHPGSRNLRFGRASDTQPQTILHAIARRRKPGSNICPQLIRRESLVPLNTFKSLPPEVESARLQLFCTLQTALKTDGSPRYATPSTQVAAYNKRSKVEIVSDKISPWKDFKGKNTVIGDDIIQIDPEGEFNIHFPWRRGQPNLHKEIGGSLSSVFTDLEDIWRYALEKLEIPLKDLKNYKSVVIVPAMFDREHAREMLNLVLNRLGFGCAFLVQDHVCATFGAGLACATVVDVGDQKISVSCVEDGISFPQSRIELKYGGIDLTLALWNLMSQSAVSLNVDLNCLWDTDFLSRLKEKLCHFDLNRCGPEEQTIIWDKPGEKVKKYNVLVGDELLICPLSFFNPDLLRGSINPRSVVFMQRTINQAHLSDDPFDAVYITETSRRGLKEAEDADEEFIEESKEENPNEKTNKLDSDQLLGIDQAILQSIDSCNLGEDVKRRLYCCILIVGGGFKFNGLDQWLHKRISLQTPRIFRTEPQEIITHPKDGDPELTCWKGGAILTCMDTANELWIQEAEFNSCGSRILREKSLFVI